MSASLLPPGDSLLRHDLQLLNDHLVIDIPLTSWPLAVQDLRAALSKVETTTLTPLQQASVIRLRRAVAAASMSGWSDSQVRISAAASPSPVQQYQSYPRDNAELAIGVSWQDSGWSLDFQATAAIDPDDGDYLRPSGTYIGKQLGNWVLTGGWQERWWGPGMSGSLILSTNARPVPAIGLQRLKSAAANSRWLRWAGPWTLTTFIGLLDDERAIENALLFGFRAAIRPHRRLEIGVSRTAQWCGSARPCGSSTFVDLLLGRDNRGVNVDPADEPGNQLGGIDVRWSLPGRLPVSAYAQWIAEDSRRGGPEIGSWLRQAGIEFYGGDSRLSHRTHIEVSETSCRDGGLGFSELVPDCGYEHSIYRSGYRYRGKSIGHGQDSDGLSFSLQTTLVQSSEQIWTISVRHMQVNRSGSSDRPHVLAMTPEDVIDAALSVRRATRVGFITAGIGVRQIDRTGGDGTENKMTALLQWSSF